MPNYNIEPLKIPQTLKFLCKSWQLAEKNLQKYFDNYAPNKNEEFITEMFHAEFSRVLDKASKRGDVEKYFLEDLQSQADFAQFECSPDKIVDGLIAEVVLHKRTTEEITGGDFGIIINRPKFTDEGSYIRIGTYRCGLLCQAKKQDDHGHYGQLTPNQQEVLQDKTQYLYLLLYSYGDKFRRKLNPFQWQGCSKHSIPDILNWLKNNMFPSLVDSSAVVQALGNAEIGTDDVGFIEDFIDKPNNTRLEIHIRWKDDKGPSSSVLVKSSQENERLELQVSISNY